MDDLDCWELCKPEHLWIFDKLILAKRLGYLAGPSGTAVPEVGDYIVRPIMNLHMMGRGAMVTRLGPTYTHIPDGFFWQERYHGRHISIDYEHGQQILAVEGFRLDQDRLDRFFRWEKINYKFTPPPILDEFFDTYQYINIELVGDFIIEVHLRFNDDFSNHDSDWVVPVWKEMHMPTYGDFYESPCGDRLGFIVERGSLRG